ncbi:hypothetical protein [Kribbella sp. NPDC050470]|uniref:hypothetical protein n=1 Tax=unclassified Kribbella TaxID=2644121 RepID=UPI0037BCF58F
MNDLAEVRARRGRNPHFVNVDVAQREVGYLELSSAGEIVKSVVHEETDPGHQALIDDLWRLAAPFVSAAADCAAPRQQ